MRMSIGEVELPERLIALRNNCTSFDVHLSNLSFFLSFSDLKSLIQHLENSKYSTIVYVLSNGTKTDQDSIATRNQTFSDDFTGYCDIIATDLSLLYNKNVIFWPCPKMKVSLVHCNWVSIFHTHTNTNTHTHNASQAKPVGRNVNLNLKIIYTEIGCAGNRSVCVCVCVCVG